MAGQKISPFDFLNSINTNKKNLMEGTDEEKQYVPFVVNRTLSYFQDTVSLANAMNIHHHIDNRLQYDFFINIVRPKKRFSPWLRKEKLDTLELIKNYYHYNDEKARSALKLLSEEQIEFIKQRMKIGGKNE